MNYEVLEKWLCEICTDETKSTVHEVIKSIREHPVEMFTSNFPVFIDFVKAEPPICNSAVVGLLTGLIIAEAWKRSDGEMEQYMKNYLDYAAKRRGENVTSFFAAKAEKRK